MPKRIHTMAAAQARWRALLSGDLISEGLITQETSQGSGSAQNTAERWAITLVRSGLIYGEGSDAHPRSAARRPVHRSPEPFRSIPWRRNCCRRRSRSGSARCRSSGATWPYSVAMADPCDIMALDEIQSLVRLPVDPYIATEEAIREAIARNYGGTDDIGSLVTEACRPPKSSRSKSPAMKPRAPGWPTGCETPGTGPRGPARGRAPFAGHRVRGERHPYRAGKRQGADPVPRRRHAAGGDGAAGGAAVALVSRIKIMSSMDIAERRVPQAAGWRSSSRRRIRLPRLDLPVHPWREHGHARLDRKSSRISRRRSGWTWRCWSGCWS